MKTWQAALAHIGTAALQAAAAVPFFDSTGAMANPFIQLGAQAGLVTLQAWIAKLNSNTAPNGAALVQTGPGTYTTAK